MKIQVPTEEESEQKRKTDRRNFTGGLVVGLLFFGFFLLRAFLFEMDQVKIYTWAALGFGVLSFGYLAKWFGAEFWQRLFGGH